MWTYYTVEWLAAGELHRSYHETEAEALRAVARLRGQHVPEIEVLGHQVPLEPAALVAALNQAAGRTSEDPPGGHWEVAQ